MTLTLDKRVPPTRETAKERRGFDRVRKAEVRYGQKLRGIAQQVGDLIDAFRPSLDEPGVLSRLQNALNKYAELITPWAEATAASMISDVMRRDEAVWAQFSKEMGLTLRQEIRGAPTGRMVREKLAENVKLIKSIPTKAGERVHKLTMEALTTGRRASEIADEIARSTKVTKSRATLIARTEVARTSAALTESRARHIGVTQYIWRTANDSDVRPSHKKMNGKVVNYDSPPTLDGMVGHAGEFPNCRCFQEPLIPDDLE